MIDISKSVGLHKILNYPCAISCRMKQRLGRDDTIIGSQVTSALQGKLSGDASEIMSLGSSELEIRSVPLFITPLKITSSEQ